MNVLPMGFLATLVAAVALIGCSDNQTGARPQLASETQCYGTVNFSQCRLKHDKAGGYPIVRSASR